MKQITFGILVLVLMIGAQSVMACKIPQPFKPWPASPTAKFMLEDARR